MDTTDDTIDWDLVESSSRMPPQDENGVDLWQIRSNLALTPTERILQNDRWAQFVDTVREAGRAYYGSKRAT